MDFPLRGDDPPRWLGDGMPFRAVIGDAVAADAEILGHIRGVDLGVGEVMRKSTRFSSSSKGTKARPARIELSLSVAPGPGEKGRRVLRMVILPFRRHGGRVLSVKWRNSRERK